MQIPSELIQKCQYILLQNGQDSVCVNFHWGILSNLGENECQILSQCIMALLDMYAGIIQIPSELTIQLELILLQDTQDSVCVNFRDILL